ncbi:hypothetical protein JCM19235_1251 [Vibrio maritimus]|uniref:Uncharacterized protein n=1 Tax=Vibrio maritimus TaxID=990268 RepID=A0A090S5G6_9VIBR|nr:hypothetical protein JCM19235_1251 [Vibrio maritimus]
MNFSFIEFYVRMLGDMAGHTGAVGAYEFKDGVSVRKLFRNEAELLPAIGFPVEAIAVGEDGELTPIFEVIPGAVPMPDAAVEEVHAQYAKRRAPEALSTKSVEPATSTEPTAKTAPKPTTSEDAPTTEKLTRDYLESVADEKGLKGLREIGKLHDVKGKSIPELIERL